MSKALAAGVRYFLAVFAIGFALGTPRTLVVVPRVGEAAAEPVRPTATEAAPSRT